VPYQKEAANGTKFARFSSDEEDEKEEDTGGFSVEQIRKYLADKLHIGLVRNLL
jgi:hypothetical protein